ncbi:MAG: hypothetical protein E7554_04060 [Ruminococcaceae bacterium]|nr:hypothetical protein [Oscillospiraceae bacterium]
MKDSRAPEKRATVMVDVLFSIEWFLLVSGCIIPFLYLGMEDPLPLCSKIMLCGIAYVVVALAMRAEKLPFLRIVVPILAVLGCILIGHSLVERIVLAAVGMMAAIIGLVIFFRLERGSQGYLGMTFCSVILIVIALVARKLPMSAEASNAAVTWVAVISAVYIPLCLATLFLNNLQDALSIFRGRSEQPVNPIRKRMVRVISGTAVLLAIVLLVIPQDTGASLLGGLFRDGALIGVGLFSKLMSACATPVEIGEDEVVSDIGTAPPPAEESLLSQYLMAGVAVIILVGLAIAVILGLVRLVRRVVLDMLNKDSVVREEAVAKYDTVEKIERPVEDKKEENKYAARTNAAKVRRIYRKRITSILGKDKNLRNSLAPDEIARLCTKKGEDVTELTRLYKKARYTLECTDEDLKAAQKL